MNLLVTQLINNQDYLTESLLYTFQLGIFDYDLLSEYFSRFISNLHQYIALKIINREESTSIYQEQGLINAVKCLHILNTVNDFKSIVPYNEFYNESIDGVLDIKEDYPRWKVKEGFSFCNYPFLLRTQMKAEILRVECLISMRHELQDAFFRAMFIGVNSPYLQLEVRRDNLVRDALFHLANKQRNDLKKQLKISFHGEEGIDEGGVQKEFFQLAMKTLFDESFGMFQYNDDRTRCWFAYDPNVDEKTCEEYHLIGILMGLAIYNGVALDLPFIGMLYKKLMGKHDGGLLDLEEFDPLLAKNLEELVFYEGNVQDVFARTFQIQYKSPAGHVHDVDLIENGSETDVTNDNCEGEFIFRVASTP